MATIEGMRMAFNNMVRTAEANGFPAGTFELREGRAGIGIGHALLGPAPGQKQELGMTYSLACAFLEGMRRALELARPVGNGPTIVRETAEEALENDRCGICLSVDHFREDCPQQPGSHNLEL